MTQDETSKHPAHGWSPGRRAHYKMTRLTAYREPWDAAPPEVREAYDAICAEHPELAPTVEEIIERDAEMAAAVVIRCTMCSDTGDCPECGDAPVEDCTMCFGRGECPECGTNDGH